MTPRRIAFDIELADVFDLAPGDDLERHAPFSISCAAAVDETGHVRHWCWRDAGGKPGGKLDMTLARDMLGWLRSQQEAGVQVVAWNGLSFDVRWLGHAADDFELARAVALDLVDPMFQFHVQRGFPVGLAAVADALGVAETKLMHGSEAPKRWQAGDCQLVLDYVAGDCRITADVCERIERQRAIRWRTKRGTVSSEPIRELLPVRALLHAPEPDVSWMTEPIPRSKFCAWLDG